MAISSKWRLREKLRSLNMRKQYVELFTLTALLVALTTSMVLMKTGVAVTHTVRVLDCHYEGVAAHVHYEECFDAEGNLVCPLPERDLHKHDESCYDEEGNLVCGREEVLEVHEHGPGCFKTVVEEVDDSADTTTGDGSPDTVVELVGETGNTTFVVDAEVTETGVPADTVAVVDTQDQLEDPTPAQSFTHNFVDQNEALVMRVDANAPQGALPRGTTMRATWIDPMTLSEGSLSAVESAVASKTDGRVTELQAIDISFADAEGKEVEPASKVIVTFTSGLAATKDRPYVVHVDDLTESQVKSMAKSGTEPHRTADVVKALTTKQLAKRDMQLADDQLAFESDSFSTYVLAVTTLEKTLVASDGQSYTVTVDAPAAVGVSQDAELEVREVLPNVDPSVYAGYVKKTERALGWNDGAADYVRLFDISIVKDGVVVQPTEGSTLDVSVWLGDRNDATESGVVHFGKQTVALATRTSGNTVSFETSGFSVYAFAGATIEKNVLASDGRNYKVTVAYDEDAQLPNDVDLRVAEIDKDDESYLSYLTDAANCLERNVASIDYARIFDISLVSKDDPSVHKVDSRS